MASDASRTSPAPSLIGQNVCATGRLLALTRAELAALVSSHGGIFLTRPKRADFLLITGDDGWPARPDGAPTHALAYAARLQELGFRIEIVSESAFLQRVGAMPAAPLQRFAIRDLSRILSIPAARLRLWVRAGLLVPEATAHRLTYFDFQQVTNARRLNELVSSGVTLRAIRQGLERMRCWLPEEKLPLAQVARLQHYNRLLWRVADRLLDRHGQQHFEFDGSEREVAPALPADVDYLFDRALAHEDQGQFDQAAELYQRAIAHAPADAVLHFNLGNVQFAQENYQAACASYERSLDIDADYVEAWTNYGNALAQLGKLEAALQPLQSALAIMPDYDLAHSSLADVLEQLNCHDQAEVHRQLAHKHQPPSPLGGSCGLRIYSAESQADGDGQ